MLTPDQIICIPSERNANGSVDIIMSNREGKVFCRTEADDRIAWEATSHSMPGDRLFPWEELPRNCSRIDVLEWYIDIANEMNLSLQNITLFPMVVDHGSLTVRTSVCNMWYSYIDRLKAESNKGKKKKWVNPISARCLSTIHHLVTNYLNDGKMLDLMPPGRERGHRKIHRHCYPNLFSLNCPSMAAVRRCNLLHHPLSKYQNLKDVGTRKVR